MPNALSTPNSWKRSRTVISMVLRTLTRATSARIAIGRNMATLRASICAGGLGFCTVTLIRSPLAARMRLVQVVGLVPGVSVTANVTYFWTDARNVGEKSGWLIHAGAPA